MKKLHFAWIEQIHSFDTAEERARYVEQQTALAQRKRQAPVQVIAEWLMDDDGRFALRIRKPYNGTKWAISEAIIERKVQYEFCKQSEGCYGTAADESKRAFRFDGYW